MLYQVALRLQQLEHWPRNGSKDTRLLMQDSLDIFQLTRTQAFGQLNLQKPIQVCFLNELQLCRLLELLVHKTLKKQIQLCLDTLPM